MAHAVNDTDTDNFPTVFISPLVGMQSIAVCMSVSLFTLRSQKLHVYISSDFLYMLPVYCISNGHGWAKHHVLPVLWMMLCIHIMVQMGHNQLSIGRWQHLWDVKQCVWLSSLGGGTGAKSTICCWWLTLKALYDLHSVEIAIKPQSTNQPCWWLLSVWLCWHNGVAL